MGSGIIRFNVHFSFFASQTEAAKTLPRSPLRSDSGSSFLSTATSMGLCMECKLLFGAELLDHILH